MRFQICLSVATLLLCFNTSQAATYMVTNAHDSGAGSLREIVANAQHGDSILFHPDLTGQTIQLTSGRIQTAKSITIDAADAPGLTLDGLNQDRILRLVWEWNPTFPNEDGSFGANVPSTVIIRNLRFINGRARGLGEDGAGGAIYMLPVGQTLTVENCIFENNYSEGEGGAAIYCGNRGKLTIRDSEFTGNIAETNEDAPDDDKGERGGTVSTNGQGTLHVYRSAFTNNRGVNGAAINAVDTNLIVEDCTFTNNDTKYYPEANPNPAAMPNYRAYGFGGAVYTDGANRASEEKYIILRRSRFIDNVASGQGGGAFLYAYRGDDVLVEDCQFIDNEVISSAYAGNSHSLGGGLVVSGGGMGSRTGTLPIMEVEIHNSSFTGNRSYSQGGGVWLHLGDGTVTEMTNCTIANNHSFAEDPTALKGLGGGLTINRTDNETTLRNLTIVHNTASHQGGGLYTVSDNSINIYDSILAFNQAFNAGNDWNITHNTNRAAQGGSNNIQLNQLGTPDRHLSRVTPDALDVDPLIEAIADNGGGTLTVALQPDSPAVDGGTHALVSDQRHLPAAGPRDIGAFEYLSPWNLWRVEHSLRLEDTGPHAAQGDIDKDGVSNLVEYALDGDPNAPQSAPSMTVSLLPTGAQVDFVRVRHELSYTLLTSPEPDYPGEWTVMVTNPGTAGQYVQVTDTDSGDATRRFYRLQIAQP